MADTNAPPPLLDNNQTADELDLSALDLLPARQAVLMIEEATGLSITESFQAILSYVKSNVIEGYAVAAIQRIEGRHQERGSEFGPHKIHDWFWRDYTHPEQSDLNWRSGVLRGTVTEKNDSKTTIELIGVQFLRAAIDQVCDLIGRKPAQSARTTDLGGRRLSKNWPDWVAEMAAYIHENGIPAGVGSQGQEEIISAIDTRLTKRGLDGPARTTVQPGVQAILDRLRAAGN